MEMTNQRIPAVQETFTCGCCGGTGQRTGAWLVRPTNGDDIRKLEKDEGWLMNQGGIQSVMFLLLGMIQTVSTFVIANHYSWTDRMTLLILVLSFIPIAYLWYLVFTRNENKLGAKRDEKWGVLARYGVPKHARYRLVDDERQSDS